MEIRNALSKLRLSSFKLAIVTGKLFKTKKEERICKFCDLIKVEDETHFLLQLRNYNLSDSVIVILHYILTSSSLGG